MNMDKEKLMLAEQAAAWLLRLESATDAGRKAMRAELLEWLSRSPTHMSELLAAKATQVQLRQLFRDRHFEIAPFLRSADNVHEIRQCQGRHGTRDMSMPVHRSSRLERAVAAIRRPRMLAAAAVACLIAVSAIVSITIQATTSTQRVATELGEWTTKTLDDGTILHAGPSTKVIVHFNDQQRLVNLTRGEILLEVAKDSTRPLIVRTDLGTARAVGTAFAVNLYDSKQVRVTVKEGVVAVARRAPSRTLRAAPNDETAEEMTVTAGEQVVLNGTGALAKKHVNIDASLAWARGQLVFEGETVGEAAQEFNRRNRMQLRVLDESLLHRSVRGAFPATDPLSFAAHLERLGTVSVMVKDSETLLIASAPDRTETKTLR